MTNTELIYYYKSIVSDLNIINVSNIFTAVNTKFNDSTDDSERLVFHWKSIATCCTIVNEFANKISKLCGKKLYIKIKKANVGSFYDDLYFLILPNILDDDTSIYLHYNKDTAYIEDTDLKNISIDTLANNMLYNYFWTVIFNNDNISNGYANLPDMSLNEAYKTIIAHGVIF